MLQISQTFCNFTIAKTIHNQYFSNLLNIKYIMVQVITREWEITKTYIFEVALKEGAINLDWNDFEMNAQAGKPVAAVIIDEPQSIAEMTTKAIEEAWKAVKGTLSSLIVVLSYPKGYSLKMTELEGLAQIFAGLPDIDVIWGVQESDTINATTITVFAFEAA